jgi:hypothetical protein
MGYLFVGLLVAVCSWALAWGVQEILDELKALRKDLGLSERE